MPKASPFRNNFNGGEVSVLLEGRTDLDKYRAFLRSSINGVATPQGPFVSRSGTEFIQKAYSDSTVSTLKPFVFGDDQIMQIEYAHERIRFFTEAGLLVHPAVAVTGVVADTPFLVISSPALGADIGDQVVLYGFVEGLGGSAVQANITDKSGDDYTLDVTPNAAQVATGKTVSRVYHVNAPYAGSDVRNIQQVQSLDVVYIFCPGFRVYKLARYDTYDWRLNQVNLRNGPYMAEMQEQGALTFNGTGNITGGATLIQNSGATGGNPYNTEPAQDWDSTSFQTGFVGVDFGAGNQRRVTGYSIQIARHPERASQTSPDAKMSTLKDRAPSDFTLEGSQDNSTWTVLDRQRDYVLYDNARSVRFKFNNPVAYRYYRLNVTKCVADNRDISVKIHRVILYPDTYGTIAVTLSGVYDDVNKGAGFLPTDVGRYIRVQDKDGAWRNVRIMTRASPTSITVRLQDEPLTSVEPIFHWRLGYFSDTTGWPTCGVFHDDRLVVSGVVGFPDLVTGSRVGAYEEFEPSNLFGEVQDIDSFAVFANERQSSLVRWLVSDTRGVVVGTGFKTFVIAPGEESRPLSPNNIRARPGPQRGSSKMQPVKIENEILFSDRTRRSLRELAYRFEADAFKAPSMSLFAPHIGQQPFSELDYAQEPYSLVWGRRDDGSVVSLTYNRDEDVIGWNRHVFGGATVSLSVLPSFTAGAQDKLWLVITRIVDGAPRNYIERLVPFWDFGDTLAAATYVDSCLRYTSETPTDVVYGLGHLEGMEVDGLADGIPVKGLLVVNGSVTLPFAASNIVLGLAFTTEFEIARIEAGAADGTAQGKTKRVHNAVIHLWDSAGGEIGVRNEDQNDVEWMPIEYAEPYDELSGPELQTGMFGPHVLPANYGKDGTIFVRRTEPLPLNVISIAPQLHTQDR